MAILDVFKGKEEDEKVKKDSPKSSVAKKDVKDTKKEDNKVTKKSVFTNTQYDNMLLRPHITEKSSLVAEGNGYTFEVIKSANKSEIKKAIKEIYNVDAIRVNIINVPRKQIIFRGKKGWKPGKKKAIVFLKKGETIEFV